MTKKIDKDKYKDKDNDKDKDILRTHPQSNPRDLWPLRHLFRVMRRHDMTKKIDKDKYKNKDILRTRPKSNPRDFWDTDYNFDNWELEFMTIFVTWQLIVTLDSIRNSCDVL